MDAYCFQRRFPGWTILLDGGCLLTSWQNSKVHVHFNVEAYYLCKIHWTLELAPISARNWFFKQRVRDIIMLE